MNWLNKLERRFGRFCIENLMLYIVIGFAVVFALDFVLPYDVYSMLAFVPSLVLKGQIWRIITFIFIPPDTSVVFFVLMLYFQYLIGSGLESEWGAFRFNVFYLFGIIGSLIAGIITGYATSYYLNLSLFIAFAALYPNFQVLLFMFIPIKIKWLAILDGLYLAFDLVFGSNIERAAIVASLINLLIFFAPTIISKIKLGSQVSRNRKNWKKQIREAEEKFGERWK